MASGIWNLAPYVSEYGVRWHLASDGGEDGGQHRDGQGALGEDQRVSGQYQPNKFDPTDAPHWE